MIPCPIHEFRDWQHARPLRLVEVRQDRVDAIREILDTYTTLDKLDACVDRILADVVTP